MGNNLVAKSTSQPIRKAAQTLIEQGWPENTLITMRHKGSAYDSFMPATIQAWAGKNWKEEKKRMRTRRFVPL